MNGYSLVMVLLVCSEGIASVFPCVPYNGACVCNVTYCDTVENVGALAAGKAILYTSSGDAQRLARSEIACTMVRAARAISIDVDPSKEKQTMIGFGGAFTDAATINIDSLSKDARDRLLLSYFSPHGIEYTLARVPIGGCDFSPRAYTYNDGDEDLNLTRWALQPEDLQHKIPNILRAFNMSHRPVRMFASPWSAPGWMKDTGTPAHGGVLKDHAGGSIHKAWAKYFSLFLNAYKNAGIKFWGVTVQNEPFDGLLGKAFPFNAMGYTKETERDFLKEDLGPELRRSHPDVKIMILDDQRSFLPEFADVIMSDAEARKYVDGIAVHWYLDDIVSKHELDETHQHHPGLFFLSTEACEGFPFGNKFGSWFRGERYMTDIITDVQNWVGGWTDWNMALDMDGGHSYMGNKADSPIYVDATKDVFYKQPMFYAMGHFSKFVPAGSTHISTTVTGDLLAVAFKVPLEAINGESGKAVATVVLNDGKDDKDFHLTISGLTHGISAVIPAHGFQTIIVPL